MPSTSTLSKPEIVLGASDAAALSDLASRMEAASPAASELLLDEIERARVLPDSEVPADVVRMNSTVEFVDEAHGASRTVQLVYPDEADIAAGKVSILTPVGAGLIGVATGRAISWPTRDGRERLLRVVRIVRH